MSTFVQIKKTNGNATPVGTLASPSFTVSNGDLLAVGIGGASTTITVSSVTDGLGGLSWAQCSGARIASTGGGNDFLDIWWAICTGAATGTVTAHFSSNVTFGQISVCEYTPTAGNTLSFEIAKNVTQTFATSTTTAAFTPAAGNNVNVSFARNPGGGVASYTAGTSYAIRDASDAAEDRLAAPTGSQTASFSWTGNNWVQSNVASFKLVATGGSTVKQLAALGVG